MKEQKRRSAHSDQGPSSKDWQPGSPGRDEDFSPEKDLWSASHAGERGSEKPVGTREVQPGTAQKGKSWSSDRPDPDDEEDKLEKALEDSFPASDPPQPAQPGVTGWDVSDETAEKAGKR